MKRRKSILIVTGLDPYHENWKNPRSLDKGKIIGQLHFMVGNMG